MKINERVLSTLKPLVASKGFGEKTLQGLATNLSTGLTDESTDEDITGAINGAMPMIELMQSENTRYANEIKKKTQTQQPSNTPTPAESNTLNPEPAGADKLIADLTKKVDLLLEQNNSLSLKQKWDKLAEANGITNTTLIQKWQPSNEEDFDSAMEELKEFSKDFIKQTANTRSPGKPRSGEPNEGGAKSITAAGKSVLERLKAQNEARLKK